MGSPRVTYGVSINCYPSPPGLVPSSANAILVNVEQYTAQLYPCLCEDGRRITVPALPSPASSSGTQLEVITDIC